MVLGLSVALVTMIVVLVVSALFDDDQDTLSAERPPTTAAPDDPGPAPESSAPPTTEPEPTIEEVIEDISAFVERERGLEFLTDPVVELADDEEFEQRLLADIEEARPELEDARDLFRALGLIDVETDLYEAQLELLGAGVVGFYDPETDELVVRGTDATPYVRNTIAHELVHALDDQHFDLDRPQLDDADDESSFGFTSLVEGNAVRIEEAYAATLTEEEQDEALEEEMSFGSDFDFSAVPLVLLELLSAPYIYGPDLVDVILEEGDQDRLDAAFAAPPVTSEQVLHPEKFLADEPDLAVPPPAADGEVFDEGAFGEYPLQVLLADDADAAATEGWGGDAYVAWRTPGDETCVRVNVAGDTPEDTEELFEGIDAWGGDLVGATIIDGPPDIGRLVTFTACG
ncbi:hypothetical protein BH24ACT3_BH24ACT3_12560 [soil metagenome]